MLETSINNKPVFPKYQHRLIYVTRLKTAGRHLLEGPTKLSVKALVDGVNASLNSCVFVLKLYL